MPVNTGYRDSRFGQFADPNFGATLEGHGAPGVLPDTGAPAGQSASSDQSNGVISGMKDTMIPQTPTNFQTPMAPSRGGQGGVIQGSGGGLMPHTGGGPVYLEDGGDPLAQDSGNDVNGGDAILDPMSILNWGRKAHGLPEQLFAGNVPAKPAGPGGDKPNPNPFPTQTAPIPFGKRTADNGDAAPDQDQDGTLYAAEGGMIPDGSDDTAQEDQGDQDQNAPSGNGQPDPKAVMSYLSGQGAMPPDQVAAIEHSAAGDKVAALQRAGSPQAAFGLMQHYRQKFNAYTAFARAAAQGAGGRKPNPHAVADALNKAYDHVPGQSVHFAPHQQGLHVTVGGNKSQSFANGGVVKGYDDGGEVEYDDQAQTQAGAIPDDQGQLPEDRQPQDDPTDGPVKQALGGKAPHEKLREMILSIPQIFGIGTKDGGFDAAVEGKSFENLNSSYPQGMEPGAKGTAEPPMPKPQQPQQSFMGGQRRDMSGPPVGPGTTPPQSQAPQSQAPQGKPQEVGAKIGAQAARDPESTLREILHNVDQMYPYVGQNTQRLAARNAALTAWMADRSKVEAEQTRGEHADKRAQIGAGARLGVADTNAGARRDVANVGLQGRALHEDAATGRNTATNQNRAQIAGTREDRLDNRLQQAEGGRNYRANVSVNPGMANEEALKRAQQAAPPRPPQGGPPAQPRPAQQGATQGDGPAPQTPPPAGMKYQVNTSGTKWRLVPAQ